MLNEIIKKYNDFSDALISEISYVVRDNNRSIHVVIDCMNVLNDYKFEKIKIHFTDVISMRFNEDENHSSTVINSALVKNEGGMLIFDFFPLIYGDNELKENENSDFKIKCRGIKFNVI